MLGLATLLAALQTCRGVVLQHFGGDCKPRTPLCGGKGARACVPGGVQEGTDPPGVPTVYRPRSGVGGGRLLFRRPNRPKPSRLHRGTSSDPAPGGHGNGDGDPHGGGLRGRSCAVPSGGGGASQRSGVPPTHPLLCALLRGALCALRGIFPCARVWAEPGAAELSPLPHRRALRGQFCRQELTWKTLAEESWQRCGASAPSCPLPPSTEQCAL